jgi:pyruvate dehydrogenase E1 component alpha subunit
VTYRLSDHTTADDARRYRDDAEVSAHWHMEPIARLRHYLTAQGVWSRNDEEAALAHAAVEFDLAAEAYLATPPQPVSAIFDHLFAVLPASLAVQKAEALAAEAGNA